MLFGFDFAFEVREDGEFGDECGVLRTSLLEGSHEEHEGDYSAKRDKEYKVKEGDYKKEVEKDGDITIKDGDKKIKIDGETGKRKVKYDD